MQKPSKPDKKPGSDPGFLWVIGAAALLVAGIYAAAVRGIADAHYSNARIVLAAAAQQKRLPSAAELGAARGSLREALRLEPSNPHFVEQYARTHEWTALRLERNDPDAREALRHSLAGFRAAARMRPGSPYVWADIAMLKFRLDVMDYEFYGALDRAGRLGPWEPAVQLAIADVGLAAWRYLARPAQQWVIQALERALLRQQAEVRRLAAAHGTLKEVCRSAGLPPRLSSLCVKN